MGLWEPRPNSRISLSSRFGPEFATPAPMSLLEPPQSIVRPPDPTLPMGQQRTCPGEVAGREPAARLVLATCEGLADTKTLEPLNGRALATRLMDHFRRRGEPEVFDALVRLAGPDLATRARIRTRAIGSASDPEEVAQDAWINVYSYPHHFDASRPGAFHAWAYTILDNVIRRRMKQRMRRQRVGLRSTEILSQHADAPATQPMQQAQDREDWALAVSSYRVLLAWYLAAFMQLSERERFVLTCVEIRGMRYAEIGEVLSVRPEALKMVVFRARRRLASRMEQLPEVRT